MSSFFFFFVLQAAYLVGIADTTSTAEVSGVIDQGLITEAQNAINGVCRTLRSRGSSSAAISSCTNEIVKHTTVIVRACKTAASRVRGSASTSQFGSAAIAIMKASSAVVESSQVCCVFFRALHIAQADLTLTLSVY